jgi:hypothetical protein
MQLAQPLPHHICRILHTLCSHHTAGRQREGQQLGRVRREGEEKE